MMSEGLVDRITEVLMEHGRRIDPNHPGFGNCRCGFVVDLPQDHAAHVAGEVAAALQLSEESRIVDIYKPVPDSPYSGHKRWAGKGIARRLVSGWEVQQ